MLETFFTWKQLLNAIRQGLLYSSIIVSLCCFGISFFYSENNNVVESNKWGNRMALAGISIALFYKKKKRAI